MAEETAASRASPNSPPLPWPRYQQRETLTAAIKAGRMKKGIVMPAAIRRSWKMECCTYRTCQPFSVAGIWCSPLSEAFFRIPFEAACQYRTNSTKRA